MPAWQKRLSSNGSRQSDATGGLSDSGNPDLNTGPSEFRAPPGLPFINLKNMQNLGTCHAPMMLAFGRPAVLRCHRVLKSAES